MTSRAHISGRHFALVERLVEGDAELPESPELAALRRWGYVQREGNRHSISNAGKLAWETWNEADNAT